MHQVCAFITSWLCWAVKLNKIFWIYQCEIASFSAENYGTEYNRLWYYLRGHKCHVLSNGVCAPARGVNLSWGSGAD